MFLLDRFMRQKDFYIFRHGETDCNREGRWQGCGIDMDLNDTGRRQAEELSKRLAPLNLQVIFSSPLKRALQTARIVAGLNNIPIEIIPDLREGCFGEAEGLLKTEIERRWPDIFTAWYAPEPDMSVGFPGGETKRQMQERMLRVLENLKTYPVCRMGIASHGSSIRYLLMAFGYGPHKMPNTALYHLTYAEDTGWKLVDI